MNRTNICTRNTDQSTGKGKVNRQTSLTDGIVKTLVAASILNPNAKYLASTNKIDISGLTFGNTYNSITDGTLRVDFSVPMSKLGPVPSGWSTWSSPPFSKDSNPDVLFTEGDISLTMELSRPVKIFGFELEPDLLEDLTFTVDFFNDSTLVESITRTINGNGGARLLAHRGRSVNRIVVTGSDDFAIAQVRYQLAFSGEMETFLLFVGLILIISLALLL